MPTEDKAKSDSSRGSSAASTPSKSPEKINLPQEPSPVVRRLVDCPLFPDSSYSDASGKKKKSIFVVLFSQFSNHPILLSFTFRICSP